MEKKDETIKEALELLLTLEAKLGHPLVISFLLQDGKVKFRSVFEKVYFDSDDSDGDSEEGNEIDLKKVSKVIPKIALDFRGYIG